MVEEKELLAQYVRLAEDSQGVTFVGRLGTYRYLDMDVTIREALDTALYFKESVSTKKPIPAFVVPPV